MDIEVRLFATVREGRFGRKTLEFPQGSTVQDVLDRLTIPPNEVAILLVNGKEGERSRQLGAGDAVSLFPAVGGG
jgi:sulfur-carrier protein